MCLGFLHIEPLLRGWTVISPTQGTVCGMYLTNATKNINITSVNGGNSGNEMLLLWEKDN